MHAPCTCYGFVVQTTTSPNTDATVIASSLVAIMTGLKSQLIRAGHDFAPAMVMYRIAEQEPVRVSDLAASCGLDASTVSRHAKTLEDQGYVSRSGDPQDRRASRLELTQQGRSYIDTHAALRAQLLSDAMTTWSADERQTYVHLTQRLAAAVTHIPMPTSSEQS